MIVTVTSFKGGVGKTTTAVHLAAYLQTLAPTLLLDGDKTKNATGWSQRGEGFPLRVGSVDQAAMLARDYQHIVIDLGQRPDDADLKAAADGCDLLIIPTVPSALETDGLGQTLRALGQLGAKNWRVLLTMVSPDAKKEVTELRDLLTSQKVPLFETSIPRFKAFQKAASTGQIVSAVDDRNAQRAWEAYAAVGKELT